MTSLSTSDGTRAFRPPAVPLVTVDPYFSVWSMADRLTDDVTRHWTGADMRLGGMALIDGEAYRFSGPDPAEAPAMEQVELTVTPTQSIYRFRAGGVSLSVAFITPLLLDDMDLMSRPASYVFLEAASVDRRKHTVALYLDVSGEWVVNKPDQHVRWNSNRFAGSEPLMVMRMGSQEQPVLRKSGDDLRIDWGYLYLAAEDSPGNSGVIASEQAAREAFVSTGLLPETDDPRMPRRVDDERPVMACAMRLGEIGGRPVSRLVTLVYDDHYSVEYFGRKLRPYWRRGGTGVEDIIVRAVHEFPSIRTRCESFDRELLTDAERAGGHQYAEIVALAYRQAVAAHKLVADAKGQPLLFSKECFSSACMATVDVTYPSAPLFLLLNTEALRSLIEPIFQYAESPLWPHDFAPHDVGLYPLANGQFYGGGPENLEMQMPVEESGNMLILTCAMACRDGDARYVRRHWDALTKWAGYLKAKGLDPENQLCTDDFAGHLAHNANLSAKAITGIACYSRLAEMLGKKRVAAEYRKAAEKMAARWIQMAADGDHYRLAFDQPGTWSMKYNLIWDRILGLKLFDPSIARTEVRSYKKRMKKFGLPLDSRKTYTKSDWLVWTAALADSQKDFQTIIGPLHRFLNESPDRVPFSDWYETTDAKVVGFRNRTVIGGVFIKMLADQRLWTGPELVAKKH